MHRILVVDDHARWRRVIRSLLANSPQWQVVGEAADALDAIRHADALRPDLILLDVELGARNGIDAAREIVAADPDAKILFVSAHRSWDIAGAALTTGARGYLLKLDAGQELLTALETVGRGRRFISARLLGRTIDTSPPLAGYDRPRCHEAAFYDDDVSMLDGLARFAAASLTSGQTVVVVITAQRRAELEAKMRARGIDIDLAIREQKYLPLDVLEMLSAIMTDGWPDEARFWNTVMSLLARVATASAADHPRLAACGEGAAFLVKHGRVDAAIRMESLWDEFARACHVDTFCPYVMAPPACDHAGIARRISAVHSAVHSR